MDKDMKKLFLTKLIVPSKRLWSTVFGLFRLSSPFAVFGTIVSVVVDSLDGISFVRPSTHVSDKVFKLKPTFADSDSSSAVVAILMRCLAETSGLHRIPRKVFRNFGKAMTSKSITAFTPFVLKATAGISGLADVVLRYNSGVTTVTLAKPSSSRRATTVSAYDSKSTVSMSSYVDKFHIINNLIKI